MYNEVQFIAHSINTGPQFIKGKKTYLGLDDPTKDIAERIKLIRNMIEQAHQSAENRDNVFKVLMMPEFFFRGKTGLYSMAEVELLVGELQKLVKDKKWKHWLFIFGSIVGHSVEKTKNAYLKKIMGNFINSKAPPSIEVYNYALVQKGGYEDNEDEKFNNAKIVLKEYKSNIDFIESKDIKSGISSERVKHLEPSKKIGSEVQVKSYDGNSIFEFDGIKFGLEICLDHLMKRLKKLEELKMLPVIDIQLIPACGMSIHSDSVVAKEDGYTFLCNGHYNKRADKDGPIKIENFSYDYANSKVQTKNNKNLFHEVINVNDKDIDIKKIYSHGAGEIHIYQKLPLKK